MRPVSDKIGDEISAVVRGSIIHEDHFPPIILLFKIVMHFLELPLFQIFLFIVKRDNHGKEGFSSIFSQQQNPLV
jgi:hypothetical protein